MEDTMPEDWDLPAPNTSGEAKPRYNPFLEPLDLSHLDKTPSRPDPIPTGELYPNGHPKTDNFYYDLWTMPQGEYLIVKEALGFRGREYYEEDCLPILQKYWDDLAAGRVPNAAHGHEAVVPDPDENLTSIELDERKTWAREKDVDVAGEGIDRLLHEQGEAIKLGLDAREAELALEEARLREMLESNQGDKPQSGGRPSLLGAALHLFRSSPQSATRVDLHRITVQKNTLAASRQQIMAAHDLFAKDTAICEECTAGLNAGIKAGTNHKLKTFIADVASIASADGVTSGHVYGRVNDPMDSDERLGSLRDIQRELNLESLFVSDAKRLSMASARATRASRHLADLLNNEGLMSAEAFKAVSVATANVQDKVSTTEFPVERANVHPDNSHLKDSIKQFAEMSHKIAEAIIAAIRGVVAGLQGPTASGSDHTVDI